MPPFNAFNIEESRGGFAGPSSETRAINADNFSRVGDGRYSQFSKEMMSFINSEEKNKQVEQNTNDRTRMDQGEMIFRFKVLFNCFVIKKLKKVLLKVSCHIGEWLA